MKARAVLLAGAMLVSACSFTQPPSPTISYGMQAGAGSAGIHTVLHGDTVYTVAKQYNLPVRDIVVLNQLNAPYFLTTGFRLKLPPPNEYRARPGDTVQIVSKLFDVPQSEVVSLNKLQPPYALRSGQTLRLPSPQAKEAPQPVTTYAQDTQGGAVMTMPSAPPPGPVEREVLAAPAAKGSIPPQPSATSPPPAMVQPAAASLPAKIPDTVPARSGNGKFMWPVQGKIISAYGAKAGGLYNDGINIKAAKGAPVRAAENGTIVYAGDELKGYGNLVIIRHADKYMTAYAHMDKILAKRGDNVKAGQSIGTVGSTGGVDAPQLHFEIRKGTDTLDPQKYL